MTAPLRTRSIFRLLFSLGLISVGAILFSVFWLTDQIDQADRRNAAALARLLLNETEVQVRESVHDYAHWSTAYESVASADADLVYDNLGSSAVENPLFDQMIILSSDRAVLHNYFGEEIDNDTTAPDLSAMAPIFRRLDEIEFGTFETISAIVPVNGVQSAVAMARITPDYHASLLSPDLPIMVGVIHLDEDWLGSLSRYTQQSDYAFAPLSAELGATRQGIPVSGPDDTRPTGLTWKASRPGQSLRVSSSQIIASICLSILAITFVAARFFHGQSQSLDRLREVASTDQLTKVLNRAGLERIVRSDDVATQLEAGRGAVLYLDLNGFKELNDVHGHRAGDIALKVTAQRLTQSVRKGDLVARLGGDEFVCVLLDDNPKDAAAFVADRILEFTARPFPCGAHEEILSVSIGVSVAERGLQWDSALDQADAAMYWAKKARVRGAAFFCESMDAGHGVMDIWDTTGSHQSRPATA